MTDTAQATRPADARRTDERRLTATGDQLAIPEQFVARNLVDLVHNSVERHPNREALRWRLPRAKRTASSEVEPEPAAWTSRTYREMWNWVTEIGLGLKQLGILDDDRV